MPVFKRPAFWTAVGGLFTMVISPIVTGGGLDQNQFIQWLGLVFAVWGAARVAYKKG